MKKASNIVDFQEYMNKSTKPPAVNKSGTMNMKQVAAVKMKAKNLRRKLTESHTEEKTQESAGVGGGQDGYVSRERDEAIQHLSPMKIQEAQDITMAERQVEEIVEQPKQKAKKKTTKPSKSNDEPDLYNQSGENTHQNDKHLPSASSSRQQKRKAVKKESNEHLQEIHDLQHKIHLQINQMQDLFVKKLENLDPQQIQNKGQFEQQKQLMLSPQSMYQEKTRNDVMPESIYNTGNSQQKPKLKTLQVPQDLMNSGTNHQQIQYLASFVNDLSKQVQNLKQMNYQFTPQQQSQLTNYMHMSPKIPTSYYSKPQPYPQQNYLQKRNFSQEKPQEPNLGNRYLMQANNSDQMIRKTKSSSSQTIMPSNQEHQYRNHPVYQSIKEEQRLASKSQEHEMLMERVNKVRFRDFQKNTRLNINNIEYANQKEKRDRATNYWKQRVIQNFLPPIDHRKRVEINERILKLKKQLEPKHDMIRHQEYYTRTSQSSHSQNNRRPDYNMESEDQEVNMNGQAYVQNDTIVQPHQKIKLDQVVQDYTKYERNYSQENQQSEF